MARSRPTPAGKLHARDAFLLPGWISFVRVVLAVVFPFVVDDIAIAVGLLAAAAASDALDGWVARRRGEETAMGAVLDAVADKCFVASVLVALVLRHRLGLLDVVLLSSREILEAPVLAWGLILRKRVDRERRANALGKVTTVLQFAALLLVLLRRPHAVPMIGAAALGVITGLTYAVREHVARPPGQ